jgi:hypothetical protein
VDGGQNTSWLAKIWIVPELEMDSTVPQFFESETGKYIYPF